MPEQKQNIEVRSDEVQEIMSHVPHWMIRWGITLIFGIILMLIFMSWFIKYPDVVTGSVSISTSVPPVKLIAVNSGEIENLHVKDGQEVHENDLIATIGNSFSEDAKVFLETTCFQIKSSLIKNKQEISILNANIQLGSMQSAYNDLITAVEDYQRFFFRNQNAFEIASMEDQLRNHEMLRTVSNEQLATARKEWDIVQRKFATEKRLFDQGVISQSQFYETERLLVQAESSVGNYKKTAVQTSIAIVDLKKDLNALKHAHEQEGESVLLKLNAALSNIENGVLQWGKNYQFYAPIGGRLSYTNNLNKHQFIEAGTNLFAVVPSSDNYVGYLDISNSGSGKVKLGQKVRIKLDKYAYQEFGQLEGKVTHIALLPNDKAYRITFRLTNGLTSSYGNELKYSPEMTGTADIITDDVRIISRVFNNFKSLFD